MPEMAAAAGPGVLYYDPNPTSAKLATAGLRLAGYQVFTAGSLSQAVELCRAHGPGGDRSVVALLLDTASSPSDSAEVLRALLQVPGAGELPGILLVSKANPIPFAGAESLPALRRPFTTPALVKILREAIDDAPAGGQTRGPGAHDESIARVEHLLSENFPDMALQRDAVRSFVGALTNLSQLPSPGAGIAVLADLGTIRLESLLEMLDHDGVRGVLVVERDDASARLHLDRGRIRMAEMQGGDEDFRLGRFVVEAGLVTADAFERAVSTDDGVRRPLGLRLVDDGLLRVEELNQLMLVQAREVCCHLLSWSSGRVTFAPTDDLHPLAASVAQGGSDLRIAEALLDGLRRAEERAEMGPQMAGADDVFVRLDEAVSKLGRHAFTRDELDVLELLNGRNAVKDIARKTRTGSFAVAKVLYRLTRASLVRRRTQPVQV